MSNLTQSPAEIFNENSRNVINANIEGFDVSVLELSNSHGSYLAIPALDPELSDICGKFVLGHLIKEIDYDKFQGKVVLIKAYY
ncbi:MAG: hypothetical protein RR063_11610 [Anaerovoracaceae bacterium]